MWGWECEGNRQLCLKAVGPGLVYSHKREAWFGTGVLSRESNEVPGLQRCENLEEKMDRKRNRIHATSGLFYEVLERLGYGFYILHVTWREDWRAQRMAFGEGWV